jgi:hypothetical protein
MAPTPDNTDAAPSDADIRAYLDRHPDVLRTFVHKESRIDPQWLTAFIHHQERIRGSAEFGRPQ